MPGREPAEVAQKPWKPLFILPEAELRTDLMAAWPTAGGFKPDSALCLIAYPDPQEIVSLAASSGTNVCVLDASADKERALAILRSLTGSASVPVLTVHEVGDGESVLVALRQGAAGFITRPVTTEQVASVLAKVNPPRNSPEATSKVICVMSASGSSGASTLACSLTKAWRKRGAKRVLLADLDRFTGCVSFLLRLRPGWSFVDALVRGSDLDIDVWNGLVYSSHGMDVLLAPEKPDPALEDLADAAPLIRFARQQYDVIVTDCDRGDEGWPLSIARQADTTLLVITPDPGSLESAKLLAQRLGQRGVPKASIHIVLNQQPKGRKTPDDVPLVQVVPEDYSAVHRALMDGAPVHAGSGIGKAVDEMVGKLAGAASEQGRGPMPKAKPAGLGQLFSFLSRR